MLKHSYRGIVIVGCRQCRQCRQCRLADVYQQCGGKCSTLRIEAEKHVEFENTAEYEPHPTHRLLNIIAYFSVVGTN